MKCEDFENRLSFFLDGETDQEESARFNEHINQCPKCRETYRESAALDQKVKSIPVFKPPGTAPAGDTKRGGLVLFPRLVMAGVLALMLLAAGVYLALPGFFNTRPSSSPPVAVNTPAPEKTAEKINRIKYDFQFNDSTYDLKVEGEGVRLVSFEMFEDSGNGIVMSFEGD